MFALGIDTSNYATSLALVDIHSQEVVCAKKRFLPVKSGGLGLRQSDAVFHHTVALPQLLEELKNSCNKQDIFKHVAAVGVSAKPRHQDGSYMPCFLAGVSFATAFAAGAGAPLSLSTHQDGHIMAALHGAYKGEQPTEFLFFHLSGGTTELVYIGGGSPPETLGGTLDLYAGQAVDRLGVQLGFEFPAGEKVSELAAACGEELNPKVSVKDTYFNLSGVQNQCEKLLAAGKSKEYAAKYCLVFIAKSIEKSLKNLPEKYNNLPVVCAGGVAASNIIRAYLKENYGAVYFAPPSLSADNAVGIALIAAKEVYVG